MEKSCLTPTVTCVTHIPVNAGTGSSIPIKYIISFNLSSKFLKLNVWICSFYVTALNSCKAEIVFGFAKFRGIIKQVLAWPFKRGVFDCKFSNLKIKDTGKKCRGVIVLCLLKIFDLGSVLWKSGTGSWHWKLATLNLLPCVWHSFSPWQLLLLPPVSLPLANTTFVKQNQFCPFMLI